MSDTGHELTDIRLARLERRIRALYRQAAKEMRDEVARYFDHFKVRDAEQLRLLKEGEITVNQYRLWRLAQIGRGERLEAMARQLAMRCTLANEQAAEYINDAAYEVYALNRNYTSYEIEREIGGVVFDAERMRTRIGVDFVLFDAPTVRRLLVSQPDLMPYYPKARAVNRGIDLEYGMRQIRAAITSAIVQGKSLKKIVDDLQQRIPTMERNSAIRAARTAMTNAQNAGRQDGYGAAAKLGVNVRKRWIATKDRRTRHAHGMADGQTVAHDAPFEVDGYPMMFPGDREHGAPGRLIYNCRCTMRTVEAEGIEAERRKMRVRDENGRNVVVDEMTYQEWEKWVKSRGG